MFILIPQSKLNCDAQIVFCSQTCRKILNLKFKKSDNNKKYIHYIVHISVNSMEEKKQSTQIIIPQTYFLLQ
jgi:predicted nucleic acid-binding Zn ribbon protein